MSFFTLALKSLKNRLFTTILTVLSIALSTALLLSVERTKRAAEEGFTQSVSGVDLIVGARSGPINLILYTVFNMGSATNNISWQIYEQFKKHPAVDWVIPYSLGDGYKGFRIVATDDSFYQHYQFRGDNHVQFSEGQVASGIWDVVLGSEVARKLGHHLQDSIVLTHGVTRGEGILKHDDKPFHVVGILKPTGTALDTSLYITLQGMEAVHIDWQSGAAPTEKTRVAAESIKAEQLKTDQITAFFLRTKSRGSTLALQREINTFNEEPLLAIIPGVTLAELWRGLGYVDQALRVISWMVLAVGLVAMLISLLTGLNERRREMAILHSIRTGPGRITMLLVFESTLLTIAGVVLGAVTELSGFGLLKNWLEAQFGLYMVGDVLSSTEIIYLAVIFGLGIVIGLIPAWKATKLALKDGLSVRV